MRTFINVDFDSRRAGESFSAIADSGAEAYDRTRHLPRVLPVGPAEIRDKTPAGRRAIIRRLARALRAERNRGRAGHWTYDLNRHVALWQAYRAERAAIGEAPIAKTTDA
jgi:hypothetical protein